MAHVHRSAGRTASGIEVEWLPFFISVENDVEIPDKGISQYDQLGDI